MESPYQDDETHPIPFVDKLDTVLPTSAGLYLGLVIASPLGNDVRSQQRLVRKIENYVAEFGVKRAEWLETNSEPMKARLYIDIHPGSHAESLELIDRYRSWIESNSITLLVSTTNAGFGVH